MKKVKVLILTAKAGGGHMAVATAISEALKKLYKDKVEVEVVSERFAPFPFKHLDVIYHWQLKFKDAGYGTSWRATNRVRLIREALNQIFPIVKNMAYRIVRKNADVIVTTHPGFVYPVLRARRDLGRKTKFITMISDLLVTHASWCAGESDLVLAPTEEAAGQAVRHGVSRNKIQISGLPIRLGFTESGFKRSEVGKFLGLRSKYSTVLLIGGGDGVGDLYEIAHKLNDSKLGVQLVVVAGRNDKLRRKLEKVSWKIPVKIYGFIDFLPQVMNAADILITKGGPTTICEGFTKGLPMIIYDYIPVQEEKNVEYVLRNNAGVYESNPSKIKGIVKKWVEDKKMLKKISDCSVKLTQKDSATNVAKIIYKEAIG
jgi:1,2-diacylglycerol 3-beta-galactosyltransferase